MTWYRPETGGLRAFGSREIEHMYCEIRPLRRDRLSDQGQGEFSITSLSSHALVKRAGFDRYVGICRLHGAACRNVNLKLETLRVFADRDVMASHRAAACTGISCPTHSFPMRRRSGLEIRLCCGWSNVRPSCSSDSRTSSLSGLSRYSVPDAKGFAAGTGVWSNGHVPDCYGSSVSGPR